MKKFQNKIALVTGAATGIGRATAIHLAQAGAKVYVTDINESGALNTLEFIKKEGGDGIFEYLDVAQKEQVNTVVAKILEAEGKLDFAVNNAGIGGTLAPLHQIKMEDWDKMLNINLTGVLLCMQAEIKGMISKGGGRIVNVSSLAGLNGMPMGAGYAAAKHAVLALTKTAAIEYGSMNIRVNAVCPGFIQTPILQGVPKNILDYSTNVRVPMKRIGQPHEVANTIAWLLSDESSYINGHHLTIDGGFMAG